MRCLVTAHDTQEGGPVPPQQPQIRQKSRSPQLFCKRLYVYGILRRHRVMAGVVVTLCGVGLLSYFAGPEAYNKHVEERRWSEIWNLARTWGGDEPSPRLLLTCENNCNLNVLRASQECLGRIQKGSEGSAEYATRNRAGLKSFVFCMNNYGYLVDQCSEPAVGCIDVPDIGYRNPGSDYSAISASGLPAARAFIQERQRSRER